MSEITKTQTKYEILIKSRNHYFKIGKILIKRLEGDIFYIPSQRGIIFSDFGIKQKIMDKVSWHKSGCVHIKMQDGNYQAKQQRQPIQEVGFQEVVRDTILDFSKLPKFIKKINNLDVVFDINGYKGQVQFLFSIVSGKLIVANFEGKETPIRKISNEAKSRILATEKRCLGRESNNTDKLLQYTLFKYRDNKALSTNRRLFVPFDSKISRDLKISRGRTS